MQGDGDAAEDERVSDHLACVKVLTQQRNRQGCRHQRLAEEADR